MPKSKSVSKKTLEKLDAIAEDAALVDREAEEAQLRERPAFGYVRHETEDELGVRLRDARTVAKLTQGELAERTKLADKEGVGITRNVISFIESGRTQPGPKELRLLCEVLRITPNRLIYGEDDPFEEMARLRYAGGGGVENFAYAAYCFSRMHHNHREALYKIMLDLLRPWNKDFDEELHREAFSKFVAMAKELEQLEAKRNALKT
jgi:transcriptional regulator with XRE-family HTH domain